MSLRLVVVIIYVKCNYIILCTAAVVYSISVISFHPHERPRGAIFDLRNECFSVMEVVFPPSSLPGVYSSIFVGKAYICSNLFKSCSYIDCKLFLKIIHESRSPNALFRSNSVLSIQLSLLYIYSSNINIPKVVRSLLIIDKYIPHTIHFSRTHNWQSKNEKKKLRP